jgi:hypothetical protein
MGSQGLVGDVASVAGGSPAGESSDEDALAMAIQRNDWERAALLLLLGVSMAARSIGEGDIDDLLAALDGEGR